MRESKRAPEEYDKDRERELERECGQKCSGAEYKFCVDGVGIVESSASVGGLR